MLISIIIPCYNCESTIERCLCSILNQTYENIEIIAVDDGSSDRTYNIITDFAKKDCRVKGYRQKNGGPSVARNYGLSLAGGEYIAFVDSDDYISPDMYEKMLFIAQKSRADMVICNYVCVSKNGMETVMRHRLNNIYNSHQEIVNGIIRRFYEEKYIGLSCLWNKLYKRDFLLKIGAVFDVDLYRGEDWWFNMKVYETASCIASCNEPLYYYWQGNPDSIMKRLDARYYGEWKTARMYLNKKNQIYGFEFDYNVYYRQLLLNVHSLLIALVGRGENIDFILDDEFYQEIIRYDKETSIVLKICHKFSSQKRFVRLLYMWLAKMYSMKGKMKVGKVQKN